MKKLIGQGAKMHKKVIQAELIFDGNLETFNKRVTGTPISFNGKRGWYMLSDDSKQSREIDIETICIVTIDTKEVT